jgi:uncharacterized protein
LPGTLTAASRLLIEPNIGICQRPDFPAINALSDASPFGAVAIGAWAVDGWARLATIFADYLIKYIFGVQSMSTNNNLDQLKSAYQTWHDTKGSSTGAWMELFADHVHIRSMHEETPGLGFAKDRYSKQEAVEYFTGLLEHWSMDHFTPEEYVCQDNKFAVFGHCAWIFKANGNKAECIFSHFWRFEDGKAVEIIEVFDSAKAAAAVAG